MGALFWLFFFKNCIMTDLYIWISIEVINNILCFL